MKQLVTALLLVASVGHQAVAAQWCPDPDNSPLRWGTIPAPWQLNPFSENAVQAEEGTRFVRANILVTGDMGRAVTCTYRNSLGTYSIWWQTMVKVPARVDNNWIAAPGGYVCSDGVPACQFYVAE